MVLNPFHNSLSSTSFRFLPRSVLYWHDAQAPHGAKRRGWQNELHSPHRKEQPDKNRWEDLQCYLHSVWLPVSVNARQQSAHLAERNLPHSLSLSQLISLLIWHLGFTGNKLLGLPKQLSHDTESECYMRNKYLLCSLFCSSSRAMNHVAFFECVLDIFSCIFPNSSKQPLVFMYFLLFSRLAVYTKTGWCWVVRHSEDRVSSRVIHFDHRLHHHCCVVFTCSITTIKGALHAFYEQTWWFHEGCWLETGDKKTLSHIWSLKGAVI